MLANKKLKWKGVAWVNIVGLLLCVSLWRQEIQRGGPHGSVTQLGGAELPCAAVSPSGKVSWKVIPTPMEEDPFYLLL